MSDVARAFPAALASLVFAASVWAQEVRQEWIPAEIDLPDDMTVVIDRAVGSTVRVMKFTTGQQLGPLFTEWREKLETAGYDVERPRETTDRPEIVFSGRGIENAKIVAEPSADTGTEAVQLDATLGR
ncbi:hypothetical protein SAMN04490244_103287 [Tranquillimonas rosea]|uniref:Uncharacterized protein n=1 Tax=Tranquillimonas rosea TaxID=641238 RepID=A0A1H9SP26_9RHOB|nr:hypothetical protein [Tranquillimonas rosea]SER86143.1 hypothetical protein SAMN04490244_103287 [Tranquillimonas rosea]